MKTQQTSTKQRSPSLRARMSELEPMSRKLETTAEVRETIARSSVDYVERFIEGLPTAKAFIDGDCPNLRSMVVEDEGKRFEDLFTVLRDEVNRVGINTASGANFAYIPGSGLWASAMADMLAAATNRYAGVYFASPGAVIIENQMIRWLCSLVGYPSGAHGNLASGGSIANLVAIQTARDAHGVSSENVKRVVVYMTGQVHHCIPKALHTTGLDEAVQRIIPMNARYQMDDEALRRGMNEDAAAGLRPFLVIATAGTTDTGAIDPLNAIADIAAEQGAWLHVDAAYGGFFALVDQMRDRFKGIERSDSVVVDPHKGLFVPFGTGVVLIRNGAALLASSAHHAAYMQDAQGYDELSPADAGPELTRHFRGLRLWLPLHLHGLEAFRAALEEKLLLTRLFHERIQELGFETGPEPELTIVLFRYPAREKNLFNEKLLNALHADGTCMFSSTTINGEYWIRCAVLNFRTHIKEIELALKTIDEQTRKLLAQSS